MYGASNAIRRNCSSLVHSLCRRTKYAHCTSSPGRLKSTLTDHRRHAGIIAQAERVREDSKARQTTFDAVSSHQDASGNDDVKIKRRSSQANTDVFIDMPYGMMRFDSMNKPGRSELAEPRSREVSIRGVSSSRQRKKRAKEKRAVEPENAEVSSDLRQERKSVFDEQYFGNLSSNAEEPNSESGSGIAERDSAKDSLFDEQFFGSLNDANIDTKEDFICEDFKTKENLGADSRLVEDGVRKNSSRHKPNHKVDSSRHADDSLFDQQYFSMLTGNEENELSSVNEVDDHSKTGNIFEDQYFGNSPSSDSRTLSDIAQDFYGDVPAAPGTRSTSNPDLGRVDPKTRSSAESEPDFESPSPVTGPMFLEETDFVEPVTKREQKARNRPVANIEDPQTPYDYVMKLRTEKRRGQAEPQVNSAAVKQEHGEYFV